MNLVFPEEFNLERIINESVCEPFDKQTISFLNELSRVLSKDSRIRLFPDVATFAFFCRRSNLLQLEEKYKEHNSIRLGRGVVFHIAPSNVPVNFAYSLFSGLISGNINIVRIPSKLFEQVTIIIDAIKVVSETYEEVAKRIVLLQYDKNSEETDLFSKICDVRVIWGGDETINNVRKSVIPTRAFDVCFADRYSICVINADEYITSSSKDLIANGFYNDTYLFDQNACTAPHLIVWLGDDENIKNSKIDFWNKLHTIVKVKYNSIQSIIAVDKLTALYKQAVESDGLSKYSSTDNLLWRTELKNLNKGVEEYRCNSGYFSEYNASSIHELTKIINPKYQTLSYFGFRYDDFKKFVVLNNLRGIDRIVPIGKTTDFSLTWDGFNLITTLSREISIIN